MARAYSDDLRGKILWAYERGQLGLEALAEQFGVSYGYTKKIRRQQLQSGGVERPRQSRHGPVSRVTPEVEEQLRTELRRQPDLTLWELASGWNKAAGFGLAGRACGKCCSGSNCAVKKIAPRDRAGQRPGAAAAASLVASGNPDRSGTTGVSR